MNPILEDGILQTRNVKVVTFPRGLIIDEFSPLDQIVKLVLLISHVVDHAVYLILS